MTYAITITTKASVADIKANFPLGAEITGLAPGDNLTVHWTATPSVSFVSGTNDQSVTFDPNDITKGTNSGTQVVAAGGTKTITFTANLMRGSTILASATGYTVDFKPLSSAFTFITDKLFAPTTGGGSLLADNLTGSRAPQPENLIGAVLTVTDLAGNPVSGVEVQWVTVPHVDTLSVFRDSAGATPAPIDSGHAYSLSDATTGEATAYFADSKTHQYVLRPKILGSHVSPQTTVIFAGTEGEEERYDSFTVPGIESDHYGQQYLNIIDTQTAFSAFVGSDVTDIPKKKDLFYVLLNDSIVIDTTLEGISAGIDLSYAALKSPLLLATPNVPSDEINTLVFFVQDANSGNVGMSGVIQFYGVGDWSGNVPEDRPDLARTLAPIQIIPSPGNGFITTDTIDAENGLQVFISPLLPAYNGLTATVLFYLNGYVQYTNEEKRGGPKMTGLTITTPILADGTKVTLPYNLIYGYASNKVGNVLYSYVDYYIDVGPDRHYSRMPAAYGTNTVYP